jgi:membrane protease YdiL (CAAX protease family)
MNPFWNPAERRPRAGWRILLQAVIIVVLTLGGRLGLDAAFGERGLAARVLAQTSITLLVTTLCIWLGGRLFDRRRFADFGLRFDRAWWVDFGAGLLLGGLLMALIFVIEWSAGWIAITGVFAIGNLRMPFALAILLALLYYTGVGINEEVLTRGYALRNLAEGLNLPQIGVRRAIVLAWVLSSVVFGLLHIGNANVTTVGIVNIMLAGMLFGLPYILTGRLGLSIGLHITWNFFQGNVFGFPVSGGGSQMTMIATLEQGPDLWTGGAFGPEGGLVGVAAMLLGCLLVLIWVRRGARHATLHLPLARYEARFSTRTSSTDRPTPAPVRM